VDDCVLGVDDCVLGSVKPVLAPEMCSLALDDWVLGAVNCGCTPISSNLNSVSSKFIDFLLNTGLGYQKISSRLNN